MAKGVKVSKVTAARHRAALLEAAGRLFRERGFDRAGIAEIAASAGLTHGAFYTHFASKEALSAEVVESAAMNTSLLIDSEAKRRAFVEGYLSLSHVLDRANGCPIAALAGDAAREAPEVRAAFSRGLDRMFERVGGDASNRRRAVATMAALVGGVTLARATMDERLRDEILAALKQALLGQPGPEADMGGQGDRSTPKPSRKRQAQQLP